MILPLGMLAGSLTDHFRKAENKSEGCAMPGIDFIYLINLDERPEKYAKTMEALVPYEIEPYRFAAVNGWNLSFEAIDELGAFYKPGDPEGPISSVFRHAAGQEHMSFEIMKEEGVSYYCHSLTRGAIGCVLSHLSVLQDAYDSGYETIWVMEDDIQVVEDPRQLSSLIDLLDAINPLWDIFFTDNESKDGYGQRVYCGGVRPRPNFPHQQPLSYYIARWEVHPDIVKLGLRFGSYSMIIRRTGMKKLLDFFKEYKIFFPYDMEYFFPPGIQMYACTRDIVTTTFGGISDVGSPKYAQTARSVE